MGLVLIVLGLLTAGLVADVAVENATAEAADVTVAIFGGSITLTPTQVVVGAAVLGALAVGLCVLGARLARGSRGRRRTAKRRISDLERENAALKHARTASGDGEVRPEEPRTVVESRT